MYMRLMQVLIQVQAYKQGPDRGILVFGNMPLSIADS